MLAYKGWKIVDDSGQFSNVIRLMVFLITGKWVNFYFNEFCFFRIWCWTWQHDPFHTKIDKCSFVFKEYHCFFVFSPRIWNVLWMRFSLKNLLHHLKIWRDDPEITKSFFSILSLWRKYAKSKHTGLSFKPLFKRSVFKNTLWLNGIASVL